MAIAADRSLSELAVNSIRMLSVDAVQQANSGHPGLPMGSATMAHVLWTEFLTYNPRDPAWPDRDRFILSAGHGSMLLYSLLYLTGYDLPLEQLKRFRQLGSMTPGHPERGDTPGVEVTTGPLGQGFANGVGMAIAETYLAARYNRLGHDIIDHWTYVLASDGDLMEGVAMEAASLAGHLGLGKLIVLYDNNDITLAGTTNLSISDDIATRFAACGWHTLTIDGMNPEEVRTALESAREDRGRPSLILAQTIIGFGAPKKEGTFSAHGSPLGPEEVAATKVNLDWPAEPTFYVPDDVLAHFREAIERGGRLQSDWQIRFNAYATAFPDLAAELNLALAGGLPEGWDSDIPVWSPGDKAISTRKASEAVIQAFFPKLPNFIGGSADLNPSTNTAMKGAGDFEDPAKPHEGTVQGALGGGWGYDGRNIHFGIREHAMGSSVNGMAAHGGVIPFGATFLVFSDYMRPPVRLAAISHLPSIFVYTHDSIAVGEDGPTHEPIEQVMALRLIPNLTVIRAADANETADAWRAAIESEGPTALIFSRQDLPILDRSGANGSLAEGGYILSDSDGLPEIVLIGTGSEVSLAVMARDVLAKHGVSVRVVSLPSWELFDRQPDDYRESVLGPAGMPRLSVEAGVTAGWSGYTGARGGSVGIDRFGASGPGDEVLAHFGFTSEHVAAEALRLLGRDAEADALEAKKNGGDTAGEPAEGADGHS